MNVVEQKVAEILARSKARRDAVSRIARPHEPCMDCGSEIAKPYLTRPSRPGWYCHVHAPANPVPPPPYWENKRAAAGSEAPPEGALF